MAERATYDRMVQASAIISANIYQKSDAPRCTFYLSLCSYRLRLKLLLDHEGNKILIILCVVNIGIVYPGAKAYYVWRNKQRQKKWNAMTPEVCMV
jgi:hypothetical protein